MGWFERLFPHHIDEVAQAAPPSADGASAEVPAERRGLSGEPDQSGLVKRVVAAFDEQGVEHAPHLYVAQRDSTVVFNKGTFTRKRSWRRLVGIAKASTGRPTSKRTKSKWQPMS